MSGQMKVMIAYDGLSYADAAINDLRRAGLPSDSEVLIVSVADFSLANSALISGFDLISLASSRADAILRNAKTYRSLVFKEAQTSAIKVVENLHRQFPGWKISYEILQGKPAGELLQKAAEWKPDLIIVGSHGRGAIGRFLFGSVSKKIVQETVCSVRVARYGFEKTDNAPIKIIAGVTTLADAERVVEEIGRRVWSEETKVRLVAIDDGVSPDRISAVYPYTKAIYDLCVADVRDTGRQIAVDIQSGHPKTVLLEMAEKWQANAIFIAGNSEKKFSYLDETITSIAAEAVCTVEIVR